MNQAVPFPSPIAQPSWKAIANWVAAILVAILFLSSGLWKLSDPFGWAVLLGQLKVPQDFSLPFSVCLGIAETLTGVLFLIPGYRRIAAWMATGLLVAFMLYMGFNYQRLHGADCSCFPFVKRAVDPAFFVEDAAMIGLSVIAGMWAPVQARLRGAGIALGVIAVFAAVSFGVAAAKQTGTAAPNTILVDGKPYPMTQGKIFIYFFDPECTHCLDAGERMAKMDWDETKFVGVAVTQPQFAPIFMEKTGLNHLHSVISSDFALLKKTFPYTSTPAGVAIQSGRQIAALSQFEKDEPASTLRKLNFAH